MLRFKLDENLPTEAASVLRDAGFDALTVLDQEMRASLDGEIARVCHAEPNPVVEVAQVLPDGTEFKAVWSYLRLSGVAKLVTVHFLDWS